MFLLGLPDSKKHKLAQPELLWKPPGAVKGKKTVFTKISNPYLRRIGAKSIPPLNFQDPGSPLWKWPE